MVVLALMVPVFVLKSVKKERNMKPQWEANRNWLVFKSGEK